MKGLRYLVIAAALAAGFYTTWCGFGTGTPAMALVAVPGLLWGWLIVRAFRGFLVDWGPARTHLGRLALGVTAVLFHLIAGVASAYIMTWLFLGLTLGDSGTAAMMYGVFGALGSVSGIFLGLAVDLGNADRRVRRDKLE